MTSKDVIRDIMKSRCYTQQTLSEKLGYTSQSAIAARLKGATEMRVDTLVKMLEAMDCELVVKSKLKDKKEWRIG